MEYIANHGEVKKLFEGSWGGLYGDGYYAFVDSNGQFVIGEERGREGGDLYRGEYIGEKTPCMHDIKNENSTLYNSIVKYFNEHANKENEHCEMPTETVSDKEQSKENKTVDYEKMWKELKAKIEKDLQFYNDGTMCSMMEAAQGSMHCGAMLKEMEDIENKYM